MIILGEIQSVFRDVITLSSTSTFFLLWGERKKLSSEQSNKNWVYGISSCEALTTNWVTKNAPVLKLYKINMWQFKILTSDGGNFSFPPGYEVVPEPKPHVVPRNYIACVPQNCHRIWYIELISLSLPHHCYYMWAPELSSHGPQKCHLHVLPRTDIRIWFPQMPSHVVPRTDILMWSPQLPSHVVSRPAITWSPELSS
jgi:hypothetical protein